jgi:hypothetical protein
VTRYRRRKGTIAALIVGLWLVAALASVAHACAWAGDGGARDLQTFASSSQEGVPPGCEGRCDPKASDSPSILVQAADGDEPTFAPVFRFRIVPEFLPAALSMWAPPNRHDVPAYLRFEHLAL